MTRLSTALLVDFYELTMANTYFEHGRIAEWAYFDYYFRRVPDQGGFAVFAGLEQVIEYVETLRFSDDDIAFLRAKGGFSEGFLSYLSDFAFSGDIYAFAEGSVVFPTEPLLTVHAPLIECQLLETFLLLTLNHQSLIATKAARMMSVSGGKQVLEFGARRAHGADAALFGARAAYIGGVDATATTLAEQRFAVPAVGTMAHSFVQSHDSEYAAFLAYAQTYPDHTFLLVDTYDTLNSGLVNAIRVHKEYLEPNGYRLKGIRLDSGDLAYLSGRARNMLDAAGMQETQIAASNSLDEYIIKDLVQQGAAIDVFGVGERLITASSEPVFGGVYKIVALDTQQGIEPKIKISENVLKTTTPGFKQVYRLYDDEHMAIADLVTLRDESIDATQPYRLFDPEYPWKHKFIQNYHIEQRLNSVVKGGTRCSPAVPLEHIRAHVRSELSHIWTEVKRLENPHGYYVDLSEPLWQLKQNLITANNS